MTRDNRSGTLSIAIEGEAKGTYPAGMRPDWVKTAGTVTMIDLGGGHLVTFHTGAVLVGAEQARFAIGTWDALQPVSRFAIGQPDYPDRSATLIVEMPALSATGPCLSGPGIKDRAHLSLPETDAFIANRALFPMGFDCFFTAGVQVAGLPRSTIVEAV